MKRKVAIFVLTYAMVLALAWWIGGWQAMRKTERLLERSERVFNNDIADLIDTILNHVSAAISRQLPTVREMPAEKLKDIAECFCIDELNVVNTNGICIASSEDDLVGVDFKSSELTAYFLSPLNEGAPIFVSQDFRHGVHFDGGVRKYGSVALADHSGVVQIGFDFNRLIDVQRRMDVNWYLDWKIGDTGHYDIFDDDKNGIGDHIPSDTPDGVVVEGEEDGHKVYCRAFTYGARRYLAMIPKTECFAQRNLNFVIFAIAFAIVLVFIMVFIHSLTRTAQLTAEHQMIEERARRRDLALARSIQLASLPQAAHNISEDALPIAALCRPAREVGGDFYDFYMLDANRFAFVVADVSGKGISAAMFMMQAKNEIHNALWAERDIVRAATKANEALSLNNDTNMFVTAWIGIVDIKSGKLEYVNCGHDRPFVRHSTGSVKKIMGMGGRPLGLFSDSTYRADTFSLVAGDALLVFTDGITEAMNSSRNLFGEKRLIKILGEMVEMASKPLAQMVIDNVVAAVDKFTGKAEQSDDITALALVWRNE